MSDKFPLGDGKVRGILGDTVEYAGVGAHTLIWTSDEKSEHYICLDCPYESVYRTEDVTSKERRLLEMYYYGEALATDCEGERNIDYQQYYNSNTDQLTVDISVPARAALRDINVTIDVDNRKT